MVLSLHLIYIRLTLLSFHFTGGDTVRTFFPLTLSYRKKYIYKILSNCKSPSQCKILLTVKIIQTVKRLPSGKASDCKIPGQKSYTGDGSKTKRKYWLKSLRTVQWKPQDCEKKKYMRLFGGGGEESDNVRRKRDLIKTIPMKRDNPTEVWRWGDGWMEQLKYIKDKI